MNKFLLFGLLGFSLTCSRSSQPGEASDDAGGDNTGAAGTSGHVGTGGSGSGGAAGSAGTTGSAGTGGAAGSAGTTGTAGTGGATGRDSGVADGARPAVDAPVVAPTPTGASVVERNNHPSRDGLFVQPTLTRAKAAKMVPDAAFNPVFQGVMWASPLYLENGPGNKGAFFVATSQNRVYAFDETTGATAWMATIGNPPPANGVACGNIHPLGIISTPVIDASARTIYVAGAVGAQVIERHEIHALSVDDGKERPGWPVDVSKMTAGNLRFDPPSQNQRSALSLVNGILYVAYGGHVGDCGPYHGWVIAVDTKTPTKTGAWATGGAGEAIWAAGGMASDGNGVFAITGNNTARAVTHADSEEVVRLTGMATLDRSDANLYYPKSWLTMDQTDADFGSNNPVYVEVPGATPAGLVVATAKDGHMYFLDSKKLGGAGGHLVDFQVATTAMAIRTAPTAYATPKGVHVALTIDTKSTGCNGLAGSVVLSVLVAPGAPVKPSVAWCAPITGQASPITTTTDGQNESLVWYISGNKLLAVDGDTGQPVFGGGTGTCAGVIRWASPIAVKGRIIVGGAGRLCSWSSP